jgi:hypothetical protein
MHLDRQRARSKAFHGSVTVDGFSIFFNWIFIIAALIVAVVSYKYLEIAGEHHGEYYSLILFAQCGMYLPGHRHRPGDALHRPGIDGPQLLRDGGLPAHR